MKHFIQGRERIELVLIIGLAHDPMAINYRFLIVIAVEQKMGRYLNRIISKAYFTADLMALERL